MYVKSSYIVLLILDLKGVALFLYMLKIYMKRYWIDTVIAIDFVPKDFGKIYNCTDNLINWAISFDHYKDITIKIEPTHEIEDEP